MRLSIDITPEQHQCLKAAAALQGKTIKAFVLERALRDVRADGDAGFHALEALLSERIEGAARGKVSMKSVDEIADEVLAAEIRK